MNEIMQIVAEKETVTKELESADVTQDLKSRKINIAFFYIIL